MKKIFMLLMLFIIAVVGSFSLKTNAADGQTFYCASSLNFFKNKDSILNTTTISSYVLSKSTMANGSSLMIDVDGYTGNGATVGEYIIQYCVIHTGISDPFYFDVKINVVDDIVVDYIFDNNLYVYSSKKITNADIIQSLKAVGVIPNVDMTSTIDTSYTFNEYNDVGCYDYSLSYNSPSGYVGDVVGIITSLQVVSGDITGSYGEEDKSISFSVILLFVLLIIILVALIIFFYKKIKRKVRRRF